MSMKKVTLIVGVLAIALPLSSSETILTCNCPGGTGSVKVKEPAVMPPFDRTIETRDNTVTPPCVNWKNVYDDSNATVGECGVTAKPKVNQKWGDVDDCGDIDLTCPEE